MEPGDFERVPQVRLQKRRLLGEDGAALPDAAVDLVRGLAAKGPVSVVDLDGLRRNKADLDTLRKLGEKGNVWVDAGSRFATDAMDLLVAGAERATLRWSHLASEQELREAADLSDAVWLGLEFEPAFVPNALIKGDATFATGLARDLGLPLVVLDLRAPGPLSGGLDRSLAARFEGSGLDRWFAGPLRDAQDARDLETMGYRGCLVDRAALEAWR